MVPCNACKANCCKSYDVFIDHQDVKILSTIKKDFSFVKKLKYERSFGYIPKFILWENGIKSKWVLALNNPKKVCSFLKDDKCSIYNNRPLICRTYPHYVYRDKIKESKNLCPVKWIVTPEKASQIESDYNLLLVNFLCFETICIDWNKIVNKDNNLKDFLIFVNDKL